MIYVDYILPTKSTMKQTMLPTGSLLNPQTPTTSLLNDPHTDQDYHTPHR